MDQQALISALTSRDSGTLAGVLLVLAVYALKTYGPTAPLLQTAARKRAVSVALSVVPVVALGLFAHAPAHDLVATALQAFLTATGLHHLFDFAPAIGTPPGSAGNGPIAPPGGDDAPKEPPSAAARWRADLVAAFRMFGLVDAGLAIAIFSCVGCASTRDDLRSTIESARDIAAAAEPCFMAEHDASLAACAKLAEPDRSTCEKSVRDTFAPIASALDRFHGLWCKLAPSAEGCEVTK